MADMLLREKPSFARSGEAGARGSSVPQVRSNRPELPAPQPQHAAADSVGPRDDALWREVDPDLVRLYRRFAIFAGAAAALIGAAALAGWFIDLPVLLSVRPDWIAMKANTAAGLIVAGGALAIAASGHRAAFGIVPSCGLFIVALGVASLAEYVPGRSFGIDQLLVVEPAGAVGTVYPGRMAMLTAVNFALCGLALLTLATDRWAWFAGWIVLPATVLSMVALLGYLFGANELYTFAGNFSAMAAHTAGAFFLLGSGIIATRIEESPVRWLASPNSGGYMLRRLLPLSLLTPAVIVWPRLIGQAAGLFNTIEFGAATVAVAMMICASGALLWCAALLDRLDRRRLAGEEQIRRLNEVLRNRVSALEVANRELEGFSYATSHVLLAPLRAMDGFFRILIEDYGDKLDSEGKRLLDVVRSSARDVRELIDSILGFLRLGRDQLSAGPIDMADLVRTVVKDLERKTRGRKLQIEIAPLPDAVGDAAMIQRVWANLLDNAVKFTAPKADARIEVGASPGAGETVYYVRDNGVGFDMQYAGKLFGVFDRLHGSEFAGNGMGLATVQRVVTRHGGRVWAEGKLGAGATVYFSLPSQEISHA